MRKTYAALLPLAIIASAVIGFTNCGGTGGEGSGFGAQFVNTSCNPDSSCLELSAPKTQIVGDDSTFRARLTDGSGNPVAGIELCFEGENGTATIVDPPGTCAFTDGDGRVSGTMNPNVPGSHNLVARAPSGFGLTTRVRLKYITPTAVPTAVPSGTPVPTNTPGPTATPTNTPTGACTSDAQCPAGQFCQAFNDGCPQADPVGFCATKRTNGSCCVRNEQCISNFCDGSGVCAAIAPTPTPT